MENSSCSKEESEESMGLQKKLNLPVKPSAEAKLVFKFILFLLCKHLHLLLHNTNTAKVSPSRTQAETIVTNDTMMALPLSL